MSNSCRFSRRATHRRSSQCISPHIRCDWRTKWLDCNHEPRSWVCNSLFLHSLRDDVGVFSFRAWEFTLLTNGLRLLAYFAHVSQQPSWFQVNGIRFWQSAGSPFGHQRRTSAKLRTWVVIQHMFFHSLFPRISYKAQYTPVLQSSKSAKRIVNTIFSTQISR